LEDAYVHLGVCKSFGDNGNGDYAFASAFNQGGASTITGYNGSVIVGYDHSLTRSIIPRLIEGDTIQTAIVKAKNMYGDTDAEQYSGSGAYLLIHGYTGWTL